jgi:predicted nucleotidyltransferase
MNDIIFKEIKKNLSGSRLPLKIIVFGSRAYGNAGEDSDIDLLVVLDKKGKSKNYHELIQNRRFISKQLSALKKKYCIDLLVYTKDEWEDLKLSGSSFFQKIEKEGVSIL